MDNPLFGDRPRTTWTTGMDRHFLGLMIEQIQKGLRHRSSFTKDSWHDMANSMRKKFGLQLDKDVLKTRFKKFRQQYNTIKVLLQHDGFDWDETKEMINGADDVWDSYLKAHPEAKSFRNRSNPYFKDFSVIYGEDSMGEAEKVAEKFSVIPPVDDIKENAEDNDVIPVKDRDSSAGGPLQDGEGTEKQTTNTSDLLRTSWTATMDRYLVEIMLEQVRQGYKVNTTFQKEAWKNMVALFKSKFGLVIEKDVLRNRIKKLRHKYYIIKSLLDHKGFTWDATRQMVTADDIIWDDYIKVHPEARSCRTTTAPDYPNFSIIFGNENINGKPSISHGIDLAEESPLGEAGGGSRFTQSPNTSATLGDQCLSSQSMEGHEKTNNQTQPRPKTNWSPSMDHYFIEIMLEHVNQGNATSTSFHREAWANMVQLVNSKFGLQLDKETLRSRFRRLKAQYNAMKFLLDHDGFSWDGTRKMVIADDSLWDKYLKEHPESKAFRNKTVPSYRDLGVIFGNPGSEGRHSFSGHNVVMNATSGKEIAPLGGHADYLLESSSHSSQEVDISNQFRKRPFVEPLNSISRKGRRTSDESMADALRQMALAVSSLANCKKESESSVSCDQVVAALKVVPDIDEDLFLDACDLLEDEQKAKMFMALDVSIRKKWLLRKLRPQ